MNEQAELARPKRNNLNFQQRVAVSKWLATNRDTVAREWKPDLAALCARDLGFPITAANLDSAAPICEPPIEFRQPENRKDDQRTLTEKLDYLISMVEPLFEHYVGRPKGDAS